MTPEEALQIVAQGCAGYHGTKADHDMFAKAIETLYNALALGDTPLEVDEKLN